MKSAFKIVGLALGAWLVLLGLSRLGVSWESHWPLAGISGSWALAAWLVQTAYRTSPARAQLKKPRYLLLSGCRQLALAMAFLTLAQPTRLWTIERSLERRIAVMIDRSASMQVPLASEMTSLPDDVKNFTREQWAHHLVTNEHGEEKISLLNAWQKNYDVTLYGGAQRLIAEKDNGVSAADPTIFHHTDLTQVLNDLRREVPAESLAGVVWLSDGRHHGVTPPDDVIRALARQGTTFMTVPLGTVTGPKDAAVTILTAPEKIYEGEKLRLTARVSAQGCRGQTLKLRWRQAERVVQEKELTVSEDQWRTEIKLIDAAPPPGLLTYQLELTGAEGEYTTKNNHCDVQTAVTNDRRQVLLIDDYPRWEFRYLKNLLDGRDRSLQLQWLLFHPDVVEGQAPLPNLPAQARRTDGQTQATALPVSEDAWREFDVVIIGDVLPTQIGAETWALLEKAVNERGMQLVLLAGEHGLPSQHRAASARALFPIESDERASTVREPYRLNLSAAGRQNTALALADSQVESEARWAAVPPFSWRWPVRQVKPWAEVWATAKALGAAPAVRSASDQLDELLRQRETEAQQALIVSGAYGLGRVTMLLFDETWRLRYGQGDALHHRFWANLLRPSDDAIFRAGPETLRLGTDHLRYDKNQSPRVVVRAREKNGQPLRDAKFKAQVVSPDGQVFSELELKSRPSAVGLYEAEAPSLTAPGRYVVKLIGQESPIETEIQLRANTEADELADLTVDTNALTRLAGLGQGRLVPPDELSTLKDAFGPGKRQFTERKEITFWDQWWWLTAIVLALVTEWILRRRWGWV